MKKKIKNYLPNTLFILAMIPVLVGYFTKVLTPLVIVLIIVALGFLIYGVVPYAITKK